MSYAGPSSQPYLGPLSQASQASHPSTGTLYPATVLQLLRAEQPQPKSNFFLDGIKLDRVLRKVFPDNKSSYMHYLGHMRSMYC
jgi:hypothetical protein